MLLWNPVCPHYHYITRDLICQVPIFHLGSLVALLQHVVYMQQASENPLLLHYYNNKYNSPYPQEVARNGTTGAFGCVALLQQIVAWALVVVVVLHCNPLGDATQYNNTTRTTQLEPMLI